MTTTTTYTGEESHGHQDAEPPYDFREGDVVVYHPIGATQTTTLGLVREVLQEPDIVGEGRPVTVKASEEDPRFVRLKRAADDVFLLLFFSLVSFWIDH